MFQMATIFNDLSPLFVFWLMVEINLCMYGSFVRKHSMGMIPYLVQMRYVAFTIEILLIQHDLSYFMHKLGGENRWH